MPRTAEARNKESALRIDESMAEMFYRGLNEITPPDSVEFAEHPLLCGKKLYPRQKTLLRLMFGEKELMTDYDFEVIEEWRNNFYTGKDRIGVPPDIWDRIDWLNANGFPHFREIEFIGGRRGGKGHLGGIVGAWLAYRLILMPNPQLHYGIDPTKDLYGFIVATNQQQARDYQFKDISETIINAPCFERYLASTRSLSISLRSRADITRIRTLADRHITVEREIASIRFVALSSNSRAGRGAATFALWFDEFAHMLTGTEGPQTGEEVYKALTPSLDQMGKEAMIYIPSSPYTKVGEAYNIYMDGLKVTEDGRPENPDILVIQLPSWSPYEDWDDPKVVAPGTFKTAPQVYDEQAKRLEDRDPESFKVERRAQWSEVVNAYLRPEIVDRMFQPISTADSPLRALENYTPGVMRWVYRGHADPSESQANFALAIGHTEPFTAEDGESYAHVIFDWLHVWKPGDFPDRQIDYLEVEREIVDIITQFRSLKSFSYDQYGGFVTVPYLKSHLRQKRHEARVHQATFTQQSNQIRAERFKSALGMGWVHAPKDTLAPDNNSLLELELKFLQVKNGRVTKQSIGPVTTKDLADCVMEVTSELLADQIDRLERNRALSNTRLAVGAPGGYHTGSEVPPQPGTSRDKLRRMGQDRLSRRQYGV